jgi:hypothetical protein
MKPKPPTYGKNSTISTNGENPSSVKNPYSPSKK